MPTAPKDRRGFLLPIALVVMVLLSLISATALYSARSDFRAARAARDAAIALAAADAGAARTVAVWTAVVPGLPAPGDTVDLGWQTLPDRSQYRVILYRTPSDPADPASPTVTMYTTGRAAPPSEARRTVAAIVEPGGGVGTVAVCCDAAVKVPQRLEVSGDVRNDPVPEVDGTDRRPPTWPPGFCPLPTADQPGVVAASAGGIRERKNGDIAGVPPVLVDPTITPADFMDLGGGLTYGSLSGAATHRFIGNQRLSPAPALAGGVCDETVLTNWGSPLLPSGPCGDFMPVVHVAGDLRLQGTGQGQGILLVDGDLQIEDQASFYGLIIVLGDLDIRDSGRLTGGIMVRGGPAGTGRSRIQDTGKIAYSSCAVTRAQAAASGGAAGATELEWFEVIG